MSRPVILNWTAEMEEFWNDEIQDSENYLVIKVNDTEVTRRQMQSWYRYPEDAMSELLSDLFKKVFEDG